MSPNDSKTATLHAPKHDHPVYMRISSRRAPTQTYQHLKIAFPYLTSRAARLTLHHSLANEWSPKSGTGISNTATVPLPKQLSRPKLNIGHIQGHARVSPGQEKDARIFEQGFFFGRSSASSVLCSWRESTECHF